MSKYDDYRSISQLAGIGTQELNEMSKKDVYNLIKKYAPMAERRRSDVVDFFDRLGIDPPANYGYDNKRGMRSWRLANFDINPSDSAGKMKSTLRTIQNYLTSDTTSLSGIRKTEREMMRGLAKRAGMPMRMGANGREQVITTSKPYRDFIKSLDTIYNEYRGDKVRKYGSESERAFTKRYNRTKFFWEIVDKVSERYSNENKGASAQIQIAVVEELVAGNTSAPADLVNTIVAKLRGDYVELQEQERANAPRYTSQTDFLDEKGD